MQHWAEMGLSNTLLCPIVGGGVKLQILGKNPQVHLIIIRELPKNNPLIIPPWCISFDPPSN